MTGLCVRRIRAVLLYTHDTHAMDTVCVLVLHTDIHIYVCVCVIEQMAAECAGKAGGQNEVKFIVWGSLCGKTTGDD